MLSRDLSQQLTTLGGKTATDEVEVVTLTSRFDCPWCFQRRSRSSATLQSVTSSFPKMLRVPSSTAEAGLHQPTAVVSRLPG